VIPRVVVEVAGRAVAIKSKPGLMPPAGAVSHKGVSQSRGLSRQAGHMHLS